MSTKLDWEQVKRDYIRGMSYTKLAAKYGKSKSLFAKRGTAEGWQAMRELNTTDGNTVNALCIVSAPQDAISRKIGDTAVKLIERIYMEAYNGCDPSQIQGYSTALKNLQQTYSAVAGTQYMLDMERIEQLKRQYTNVLDGDETGVIIMPEVQNDG